MKISELATTIKMSVDDVLKKLKKAGIHKTTGNDVVSDDEKMKFLNFQENSSINKGQKLSIKKRAPLSKSTISLKKKEVLREVVSSIIKKDTDDKPLGNIVLKVEKADAKIAKNEKVKIIKETKPSKTETVKNITDIKSAVVEKSSVKKEELPIAEKALTIEKVVEKKVKIEVRKSNISPLALQMAQRQKRKELAIQKKKEEAILEQKATEEEKKNKPSLDKKLNEDKRKAPIKDTTIVKSKKIESKIKAPAQFRVAQSATKSTDSNLDSDLDRLKSTNKVKKAHGRKKKSDKEIFFSSENFSKNKKHNNRRNKRLDLSNITVEKFTKPVEKTSKVVKIADSISVIDLADQMSLKSTEIIKSLMKMGMMITVNEVLEQDTAMLMIEEFGHQYEIINENQIEDDLVVENDDREQVSRAPIVTIMGHVDHGKTSLLDFIRKTKVTEGESGGITQHIGAYSVNTSKGDLTFLDTPGHEAFTSMRARGANCTDIVILVVAADDGVMPQTIEAVKHTKAAGVPMVVAVNKIDKAEADQEKVTNELSQYDVISEAWGGDTMFIEVSAKTGQGVNELLEAVALQAEFLELKAANTGFAEGVVIESRLDKSRGSVATVLIKKGLLKQSDIILAGTGIGKVRAMINSLGERIKTAGPSTPVEILGLNNIPMAGDSLLAVKDEKTAKEVAEYRRIKEKADKEIKQHAAKLSNLFSRMDAESKEQETLNILVKSDVQGSNQALCDSLNKLSTSAVKVNIISSGVGGINSSDVALAQASCAVIFGFNVRADTASKKLAEKESLEIRYYSIIYDLIDDVKQAMTGLLSPVFREEIIGIAQVRDVFRSSKFGTIAGCMVTEGSVKRNSPIRVLRDNIVIYEGSLESLKRFKEDANEVKKNMECGIGVKNYNDVKSGDQIEVFEVIEEKATL